MSDIKTTKKGGLAGVDRSGMKRGYLVARGYVFVCGVVVILSTYASQVVMPELYYEGPVPPSHDRAVDIVAGLGYALLLVLPYRWSVRGWAFRVRFTLLFFASLWLSYGVASGIYGFIQGQKHWFVVPASVLILGLAILAPSALVVKRKQVKDY